MLRLLPLLALAGLLGLVPATTRAQGDARTEPDAVPPKLAARLGAGWHHLDAGALKPAEDLFTSVYETREGKDLGEVYYALAAIWWARRNALAACEWLREGVQRRRDSWYWNGGKGGAWDRRIDGRLRYIERNFTVLKLRLPRSDDPIPPLADPPPSDPLLRGFSDIISGVVREAVDADARLLWIAVPHGTYRTGAEVREVRGGELEPSRAQEWALPPDRGTARRQHLERVAELAALAEESRSRLEAEREARRAAWGGDQPPARVAQSSQRAPRSQPAAAIPAAALVEASPSAPLAIDPSPRPIGHRLVTQDNAGQVSADVSGRWRGVRFRVRYGVTAPDTSSAHTFAFPDAGFSVSFSGEGLLRVRGVERLTEALESDWIRGVGGQLNLVELWYDGHKLLVVVNGVEIGPVAVRRSRTTEPVGNWELSLTDPRAEIQHLWIEPWLEEEEPSP